MVTNNIDILLDRKLKSRYWLAKQVNVAYPNIVKLANNQTSSINFELMENLCVVLNCTLNDLFTIEPNNKKQT